MRTLGFYDADCETPETGDIFRTGAGEDSAAVFILVPVDEVMAAIFNGPVAAVGAQNPMWVMGGSAGDAVGDFLRLFPALFVYVVLFDEEGLPDVGKVEVVVEFGCGPDFTGFNSAIIRGLGLGLVS